MVVEKALLSRKRINDERSTKSRNDTQQKKREIGEKGKASRGDVFEKAFRSKKG